MFKFLAIIFLFILSVFLILGVFLGRAIRSFGPPRSKSNSRSTNNKNHFPEPPQKKFSKNEGEYVNYEEVKDEE